MPKQRTPVRERFIRVMRHGDVSQGIPIIEWAGYWDLTLKNWLSQGLSEGMDLYQTHEHFGLDAHFQHWFWSVTGKTPQPASHGAPIVRDAKEYEEILPTLYPEIGFDPAAMEMRARRQAEGSALLWITLDGPFWFPRRLLGIEPHLLAFCENPDLMKRINQDIANFNIRAIEAVCKFYRPDFMTFAEDMSYNHGSMISRELFEEFMAPYYRQMLPVLKKYDIMPIIDSDGDVEPIIPWFEAIGVEGILPLERMAGVDVNRIRRNHPEWKMIGGFDKTVMHLGEEALRAEFQRIKPAVLAGRYIPSVDHQTPPAVGLDDYRLYVRLLHEFSDEVAREAGPLPPRRKAKPAPPKKPKPPAPKRPKPPARKKGKTVARKRIPPPARGKAKPPARKKTQTPKDGSKKRKGVRRT